MSTTRYIELNSTYRNRNIWPLASEFQIPISQTGKKENLLASDPVCASMPIFSWTSNNLLIGGSSVIPVLPNLNTANIVNPGGTNTIGYSSDSVTFIIITLGEPQHLRNYYAGLVLFDSNASNPALRRIIYSSYLGVDSSGKYRTQITASTLFSDALSYNDKIYIYDPTDFTDVYNPLIWVPNGPYQENAYNGYILYNETCNQYRPILYYDNTTNMIKLDTSGSSSSTNSSGPITTGVGNWNTTDSFSIRKTVPLIPDIGSSNPVITVVTSNTIKVNYISQLSIINDFYKNYFVRVLPTGVIYNYNPVPSNNIGYKIISYIYDPGTLTCTFEVYPSFNVLPLIGDKIEILKVTDDNFNPFIYNGSLVSQQEMVCYELQLISLTLPNAILTVGNGGRIAFYPYVYVEISNVSASGAGLKNIIYSNNPNSTNVIFRAPIYDVQNPLSTPFVRIDGGGMSQTIKFKPNDNLYFKVTLGNGDVYKTVLNEYYSPLHPNPLAQITALISFKRI